MELKELTAQAVMEVMDQYLRNWEIQWADSRDLAEALWMPEERRKDFLQGRMDARVMLVLRAAYKLTKEPCDAKL